MPSRIFPDEMEGIRHFALIMKLVDSAARDHLRRKLRLTPADVHGRDYVVEKIRRDAARVVPVFAEAEVAVGIPCMRRRGAKPHLPVNIVLAFLIGTRG